MRRQAVAAGLLLICLLLCAAAPGRADDGEPVAIVIDAGRILAPVSPLLLGQNYGPWMNTTPDYVALYRDAGVSLLRAPAGNWGDENDLYPNTLDDLAALAEALDAEVAVQARSWRSGTPEKAAEAVRYANIENDYSFRYWEVGNEPDLYERRLKRKGDPVFDMEWYNAHFRAMAAAMKAADPTILVAGPAVTGGWPTWMPAFIRANGDIVDVLSWHWYPNDTRLDDAAVLATPPEVEEQVRAIRAMWADPSVNPLGHQRATPPLFLSEYNVSSTSAMRKQLGSQVGALWNAEVVGRLANRGVEMAAHFALQGTEWQGLVGMLEDPRPVYDVYRLYAMWGDRQVSTESSDDALLPAFASLRSDGALALMLLNKDPVRARRVDVQIRGFEPGAEAQIWLQDETHAGDPLPAIAAGRRFQTSLPPYSVTLLTLAPAPGNQVNSLALAVALCGLALAAAFIVRRRARA
jgi:hypothetical protein